MPHQVTFKLFATTHKEEKELEVTWSGTLVLITDSSMLVECKTQELVTQTGTHANNMKRSSSECFSDDNTYK